MKSFYFVLLLAFSAQLSAQNFTIKGKISDDTGAALPGAYITLQYPWGEDAKLTSAENDGSFELKDVEKGGYKVKVSYIGFDDLVREVTISNASVDLGTLKLATGTQQLAQVEVKELLPQAQVKGDTSEFNANAFKVMKDASAEDLVSKMPTVTIENGKVQAQGEDVKQVLVDGKPFFGNDPTAALRNLPAEVIQKIQVYDQSSDQVKFTGMDDGNSSKTINIVTKNGMNNGQFGKIYAGYGTDEHFQMGGNMNFFDGDRRISVIGLGNNVNVQNFSSEDLLGVTGGGGGRGGFGGGGPGGGGRGGFGGGGTADFLVQPSGGIAKTYALGLNYSDKWGKKTEVSASYFFNKSNTNSTENIFRQFIDSEGIGEIYDENSTTFSSNMNHRLNGRLTFELDSFNSLILRPSLSLQLNDGNSKTFGQTTFENDLLNQTDNSTFSNLMGMNLTNSLLWRHKFSKERRTFSVDVSTGYAPQEGDNGLNSLDAYFTNARFDTLNQRSTLDKNKWNASTNLTYTEPVGENGQVETSYQASWQQEESDKYTNDFSEATGGYDMLNEQLSNVFSNDYFTQQARLGYSYNKGRDLNVTARASYQWARLLNEQAFPDQREFDNTWQNVLPFAMVRWNIDRQRNVRLFYRTNTDLPSVSLLQNVLDNSNPLQLTTGNPDLVQSFSHNLFMRYQATNTEKSTVFFAMLGGGVTNNYIGKATYFSDSDNPIFQDLDVPKDAQLTRPVNLDGYRNMRSFLTYGLPLKPLKSTLNLNLTYNYSRTPGLLNDLVNYANSNTAGIGLTLSSNISDRLDFSISSRSNLSRVKNTLSEQGNNDYWNQNSKVRLNWIIFQGFVLRTDLANQLYRGLSDSFNQNYWLWNFGIGKKVFKERGELTLSVNDLLNQNRNISRNVTETYIEDVQTNDLQQYFMLTFTYNLRNFNSGKPSTQEERRGGWEGGRPMGN